GEFLMGTPEKPTAAELAKLYAGQAAEYAREMPQHRVRISKPFWLGKVEATQEQWQTIMGANPSKHVSSQNPVEQVSWDDCQDFLGRLGEKTGQGGFCLPTEAQWEYACRVGTVTRYHFGDEKEQLSDYGWWVGNSAKQAHPVGTRKPNPWGLHDLHGGVFEWCQDGYGDYVAGDQVDPTGVPGAPNRPLRGGSWGRPAYHCSSPYRNNTLPGRKYDHVGLRVCLPIQVRPPAVAAGASFFHGAVSRLPDGRVELRYDWSDKAQLADWEPGGNTTPEIVDGEVRFGGIKGRGLKLRAVFRDRVEVSTTWTKYKRHGNGAAPSISIFRGEGGGYGLCLNDVNPTVIKNRGTNIIARGKGSFESGKPHTCRYVRDGDSLVAYVDGKENIRLTDPDHTSGAVSIYSWSADVGFRDVRITGVLDPAWLVANPEAKKQIDAAPVIREPVAAVRPGFYRGAIGLLPDGRVEFRYDWSDKEQLQDWIGEKRSNAEIINGELRFGGKDGGYGIVHRSAFVNDVEVSGPWMVTKDFGFGDSCGAGVCFTDKGQYHLSLMVNRQRLWKNSGRNVVCRGQIPANQGGRHTFHFSRKGAQLVAKVNGQASMEFADADHRGGAVLVDSWNANVSYGEIRIVGRLDPAWLAANPDAKAQIDALGAPAPVAPKAETPYAKGVAVLKPLWQKRAYADALAKAKTLGDKGLIEDAEALAGLWAAVQAGAAKLKPGDPLRIRGMAGKVTKVDGDTIHAKAGPVELGMKLAQLDDAALMELARKGRPLTDGKDLLALALLEMHAKKPNRSRVQAALARAEKAGVDTVRHKMLLTGKP
ncbi:formylglycine-generating enzyme family protein, partial [bacterium]|nr:formylglycine-generating enzyme family protein [bacterium]